MNTPRKNTKNENHRWTPMDTDFKGQGFSRIFHYSVGRRCSSAPILARRGNAALSTSGKRFSPRYETCWLGLLRARSLPSASIRVHLWFHSILAIFILVLSVQTLAAQPLTDQTLQHIEFDQKLGQQISLDLPFRDETGKTVHLRDYFNKKPVILDLGYYGCPMLCTFVLNGMIGGLQDIKLQMGRDYEVVNVSIDPTETPALAAAKKKNYVERFGRPNAAAGWHFLTGDEPAIRHLAAEVGFKYAYDPEIHQYAHPSGLTFLSPDGKISHYLSGVSFSGAELNQCLRDARGAKIGSPIEQIFLLCFHYSPVSGKYSGLILGAVRGFGIAVAAGLVLFIVGARRRVRPSWSED